MTYGLQQIFEESVSAVTASPSIALGTERWENGNKYEYMYNGTTTAAVGFGVNRTGANTATVTSVGGELLAGIVQNTALATESYGWVCVKGTVAGCKTAANSVVTAGQRVLLGTDGLLVVGSASSGHIVNGTPLTTTASGGTFSAFVCVG